MPPAFPPFIPRAVRALIRPALLLVALIAVLIASLYLPPRLAPLTDLIWAVCAVAGVVVVAGRLMPPPEAGP